MEENIEETLTFYRLPREHYKHLKSTNMLERLNQEIKHRTHVIRLFPKEESALRLIRLHPKSTGLADEGELGFMKSVEAQFEKIVVAKAKGAGEQTANLAIDSFHLSAGQTGVVKA